MNEQALLAAIGTMIDEKLAAMETRINEKLAAELKPIKADIAGMKADIVEMKADIAGMKIEIKELRERTTRLEITVEHKIDWWIKLLGDGQISLQQIIVDRLATREEQEKSDVRLFALEKTARLHTAQIEELRKKIS